MNDSKGICQLCQSEITFNTSIDHLENDHLELYLDTANELFLLGVQLGTNFGKNDDYTVDKKNQYWLVIMTPASCKFTDLDKIIKSVWCQCCPSKHICDYTLCNKTVVTNKKREKSQLSSSRTTLSEGLKKVGSTIKYEFDAVLTNIFYITLLKIIQPNKFNKETKLYNPIILCQNSQHQLQCKFCKKKSSDNNYCSSCKYIFCDGCSNKHKNCNTHHEKLTNDPRSGVSCVSFGDYKIGKFAMEMAMLHNLTSNGNLF